MGTKVQPRDVTHYAHRISYSFARSVHTWELGVGRIESFIGVGISTFAAFTEIYRPPGNTSYFLVDEGWYWSHAVNLFLYGEYRLTENSSFSLHVGSPVFRIVSRPSPGHDFDARNHAVYWEDRFNAVKGGESEFVWENLVLLGALEYSRQLGTRFGFRALYSFGYVSVDRPLPMKMSTNNFSIGIRWMF